MEISYPRPGCLRVKGASLFSSPEGEECRKFAAMLFQIPEVIAIEIETRSRTVEVHFDPRCTLEEFAEKVDVQLVVGPMESQLQAIQALKADWRGDVRIYRQATVLSTWKVVSDIPGRIRFRNSRLFRKKALCGDIERELMTVYGIERFRVKPMTCSALIYFDPKTIDKAQLLEFLEVALHHAEEHPHLEKGKYEVLLCTATLAVSATAQFAVPGLLLPSAALFLYCAYPTFLAACETLFVERRLGVDVLDAIVIMMCLGTSQIFAGAVLTWCLAFGRSLLARTQEDSRRRLVNVFGKQVRTANLYLDGQETSVPLEQIKAGDTIVVNTGQMVPVDGVVCDGVAAIDQHVLTGESVPVEKEVGSRVFASTLVMGGRILVTVEKAGAETTSARISAILNETASFRFAAQSKGEDLADKMVLPTLALASMGYWRVGMQAATAIVNCDFGTGIRMAAPLAVLSSLSVCSSRGILVKDGRALEQIESIDTVLFDKTGTLTHERPTVHRIHRFTQMGENRILMFAAAAESHLDHPIALAITERFRSLGKPLPKVDRSSYKAGYGIKVVAAGKQVLVGSSRFMQLEGIKVPRAAVTAEEEAHAEGHSSVFLAVEEAVVGAIELAPTLRPGVRELFAGLRKRGVREIVIISGDHKKPTQRLAEEIGADRFFAEVLPAQKAQYVEFLQSAGRKVCFVGDGINDSIALKRANVSISLRGAATVALDTAQVVFIEDNLWKLCELIDISRLLDRNIRTSWMIILVPNLICIAGAFFAGFGVIASVMANNVAAIGALANGLRPKLYKGLEIEPGEGAAWLSSSREWAESLVQRSFSRVDADQRFDEPIPQAAS